MTRANKPDRVFRDCPCDYCITHRAGVSQAHRCASCKMTAHCDAEVKAHSLTAHLVDLKFLRRGDRSIVDALSLNCKLWRGK